MEILAHAGWPSGCGGAAGLPCGAYARGSFQDPESS